MRILPGLCLLLAVSACSETPRDAEPGPPPSTVPTRSTAPANPPAEDPLEALPTGPPPHIAYADKDVIVHPDGRRERMVGQRRIGVSAFIPFRDGWIVADERWFEGTVGLAYVRGHRRTELGPCASGGAVLSRGGRDAAWMTQGCPESNLIAPTLVHVASTTDDGEELRELDRVGITSAIGFLGDEVVVSGFHEGVQLVGPGGVVRALPRLRFAADTSDDRGLAAGVLRRGTTFGAVMTGSGTLVWRRRHTEPTLFSPDGNLLVAYVRRRPALLGAGTGAVVALVKGARLAIHDWAWEDDRHLLAVASAGTRQAMVRVDMQGNVTRVGPVVRPRGYRFVFETRP